MHLIKTSKQMDQKKIEKTVITITNEKKKT